LTLRAAVFASGRGSNFEVLAEHAVRDPGEPGPASDPPWQVVLLVTDRPDAGALERARVREIPSSVVLVAGRDPGEVARDLLEALETHEVDLVLLAGYLRLVPAEVVQAFRGRMLNVHPALLPSFGGKGMYGLHVHRAVLDAGARITGPTVHFVDERYDRGRILAQWPVPVLEGDTPESLARRVNEAEHRLYPAAVDLLAAALAAGREPAPIPTAPAPGAPEPRFVLSGEPPAGPEGPPLRPEHTSDRP
jgi:phosphoribosylglycinamide formyltransferase 1